MSIAIVSDRIAVAQDAPWALDVNVWGDALKTVPINMLNGEAYLSAASGRVAFTSSGGRLTLANNTLSIRPTQSDLAQLPAGPAYLETRFQLETLGAGRVDFTGIRLIAGLGAPFPSEQGLGLAVDIMFSGGGLDIIGFAAGPIGPSPWSSPVQWTTGAVYKAGAPASCVIFGGGTYVCLESHVSTGFAADYAAGYWSQIFSGAADEVAISADGQAELAGYGLPATNVEAAILQLATALKSLTGETPAQETIFSTT